MPLGLRWPVELDQDLAHHEVTTGPVGLGFGDALELGEGLLILAGLERGDTFVPAGLRGRAETEDQEQGQGGEN